MKFLPVLVLLLPAVLAAQGQDDDAAREREHERIRSERAAVDARFAARKTACNAKFAVTDCVQEATRERNAALGDLRRQERILNDAERRQRAAERLQAQQERNSPERQRAAEERRARAVAEQKEREGRAADKAAKRAADQAGRSGTPPVKKEPDAPPGPQGSARAPQKPKEPPVTADEAARNRAAYEARLREAEVHKAEVRERTARRSKPAASALPVPQ